MCDGQNDDHAEMTISPIQYLTNCNLTKKSVQIQ